GRALAAVQLGNTGTQRVITRLLRLGWRRRAALLTRLLALAARRGPLAGGLLLRRLPLLGIPVGALANAVAVTTVGTEARNRYHPSTNLPVTVDQAQSGGAASSA